MAAPLGNQNAKKARMWSDAIRRAIARRAGGDLSLGLDNLADQFVEAVSTGDLAAYRELGDRLDGKPPQAIVGGDEDDAPLRVVIENQDANL